MTHICRRGSYAIGVLAALAAHTLSAAAITVAVATKSGVTAEDTLVVFDPLDGMPPAAHDSAVIDQVAKQFVPRVSIVRTGTSISFPNSDHIRHQVYSFSPAKVFTLKLYAGSPHSDIVFDKPGLVVLGCNIHDNMAAFVGIVDSPYFAKLSGSGSAVLNLPTGRYRLHVWHPNLTAAVDLPEIVVQGSPQTIPIIIELNPASTYAAAWPE
jgi:plastocyanin